MDILPVSQKPFKRFSNWYKYMLVVIAFFGAIALFNGLGRESASAVDNDPRANTEQPESSPVVAATNSPSDPELEELNSIVSEDQNSGRVLSAQSVATFNENSSSTLQISGLLTTTANVMSNMVEGDLVVTSSFSGPDGQEYAIYKRTGALAGVINMTGSLYQSKPVSVEVWAQDIQNRINPTAYAQSSLDSDTYNPGQGYELLSPIQNLWRAGVNLVYVLYILIIVVMAFLILFRSQLGGQEAVTLFNAIPSLIISLVLVYFSYPVSALFIDMVSVGSGAVYGALIGTDASSDAPGSFLYTDPNLSSSSDAASKILFGDQKIDPKTGLQIDDRYVNVWQVFSTAGVSPTGEDIETIVPREVPLVNQLENIIGNIAGNDITDSLLKLIFTFAAFSASLKLFFSLMRSYVFLVLLPLVSPFIFLVAAIPGQTGSIISQYFGRLAASALSFVAVYAVFLVIIIIARDNSSPGDVIWVPPLLGYSAEQTISGGGLTNIARPLIAYALFISTPMIPDYIFELFQQNNESPFVQNITDTTKAGARNVLGFGTLGYRQMQNSFGFAPEERR